MEIAAQPSHLHDLDTDFLNIDSFFTHNDDDHTDAPDDLWFTQQRQSGSTADDDWLSTDLEPLLHDPQTSPLKFLGNAAPPPVIPVTIIKTERSKRELSSIDDSIDTVEDDDEDDGYEEDDEGDSSSNGGTRDSHYSAGDVQSEAEGLLDDPSWLDMQHHATTAAPVSTADKPEDAFLLFGDTIDCMDEDYSLPELTDDDMSALMGSSVPTRRRSSVIAGPAGRRLLAALNDFDIPDMVDMFSSMHSPSEAVRLNNVHAQRRRSSFGLHAMYAAAATAPLPLAPPVKGGTAAASSLSIRVPAPIAYNAPLYPFGPAATGVSNNANLHMPPAALPFAMHHSTGHLSDSMHPFDYYTPPAFAPTAHATTSAFVNAAETLSPAPKPQLFTAMLQAKPHVSHVHALAMANAAAAKGGSSSNNTMASKRKLSLNLGASIAPLYAAAAVKPKPKAAAAGSRSLLHIATTGAAASKSALASVAAATKATITADSSDFKLVQIFHAFCDPTTKRIDLPRFHQLLRHHQAKDDTSASAVGGKNANANAAATAAARAAKAATISSDTQHLFTLLDPQQTGSIGLERFMTSFQICNRCSEAKRRAQSSAAAASQSQSQAAGGAPPQGVNDSTAPPPAVLVRVVPTSYEGPRVKSCEHYQWTWCEGFDKTGNEKCRGTNRHDKCPKYLANCTLWKHKLPPKKKSTTAKTQVSLENQESPSKKFKHFA